MIIQNAYTVTSFEPLKVTMWSAQDQEFICDPELVCIVENIHKAQEFARETDLSVDYIKARYAQFIHHFGTRIDKAKSAITHTQYLLVEAVKYAMQLPSEG